MSLTTFHTVFILASMGLSAYVSFWSWIRYKETPSAGFMALGIAAAAMLMGMFVYLLKFKKMPKTVLFISLASVFLSHTSASACAVCFMPENEPSRAGLNNAILFLLIVTALVLAYVTYMILQAVKSTTSSNENKTDNGTHSHKANPKTA